MNRLDAALFPLLEKFRPDGQSFKEVALEVVVRNGPLGPAFLRVYVIVFRSITSSGSCGSVE